MASDFEARMLQVSAEQAPDKLGGSWWSSFSNPLGVDFEANATRGYQACEEEYEKLVQVDFEAIHEYELMQAVRRAELVTFLWRQYVRASNTTTTTTTNNKTSSSKTKPAQNQPQTTTQDETPEQTRERVMVHTVMELQSDMFKARSHFQRKWEHVRLQRILSSSEKGPTQPTDFDLPRDKWFIALENHNVELLVGHIRTNIVALLLASITESTAKADAAVPKDAALRDEFIAFVHQVLDQLVPPPKTKRSANVPLANSVAFMSIVDEVCLLEASRLKRQVSQSSDSGGLESAFAVVKDAMTSATKWMHDSAPVFASKFRFPHPASSSSSAQPENNVDPTLQTALDQAPTVLRALTDAVKRLAKTPVRTSWAPKSSDIGDRLADLLNKMRAKETKHEQTISRLSLDRRAVVQARDVGDLLRGGSRSRSELLHFPDPEVRRAVEAVPEIEDRTPSCGLSSLMSVTTSLTPADVNNLPYERLCELAMDRASDLLPEEVRSCVVERLQTSFKRSAVLLYVENCSDVNQIRVLASSRAVPMEVRSAALTRMARSEGSQTDSVWVTTPTSLAEKTCLWRCGAGGMPQLTTFGVAKVNAAIDVWQTSSGRWLYELAPSATPTYLQEHPTALQQCSSRDNETWPSGHKELEKAFEDLKESYRAYTDIFVLDTQEFADYDGETNRLIGRMSKPCCVNVTEEGRKALDIPENAMWYAWLFPVFDWQARVPDIVKQKVAADFSSFESLLFWGGFVYFAKEGVVKVKSQIPTKLREFTVDRSFEGVSKMDKVVRVTSLNKGSAMNFGAPQQLTGGLVSKLIGAGVEFRPVTLGAMRSNTMVKKFAWIPQGACVHVGDHQLQQKGAGDAIYSPYGGFAYLYGSNDAPESTYLTDPRNNFFALVGPVVSDSTQIHDDGGEGNGSFMIRGFGHMDMGGSTRGSSFLTSASAIDVGAPHHGGDPHKSLQHKASAALMHAAKDALQLGRSGVGIGEEVSAKVEDAA